MATEEKRQTILDPLDRIIETIFGLVMVLTFTCTFSVESTRADAREMLRAAIGCNVAWGIVDGVMYLVARISTQMRGRRLFLSARDGEAEIAAAAIAEALPPVVVSVLGERGIDDLRRGLKNVPSDTARLPFTMQDILGAIAIFMIAVVSVAPVVLPFVLMKEPHQALRLSNGIALLMLFLVGEQWAGLIGMSRWRAGVAMALGGAVIVGTTIALGG